MSSRGARRWDVALVIGAGGVVGGLLRRVMNVALPTSAGGFPWSTFLENVSGSLLLAALMVYVIDVWPPSRYVRPFFGVGVLGSYTTFSAFTNETRILLVDGDARMASVYVGATIGAGLAASWTGVRLARVVARSGSARGRGDGDESGTARRRT